MSLANARGYCRMRMMVSAGVPEGVRLLEKGTVWSTEGVPGSRICVRPQTSV